MPKQPFVKMKPTIAGSFWRSWALLGICFGIGVFLAIMYLTYRALEPMGVDSLRGFILEPPSVGWRLLQLAGLLILSLTGYFWGRTKDLSQLILDERHRQARLIEDLSIGYKDQIKSEVEGLVRKRIKDLDERRRKYQNFVEGAEDSFAQFNSFGVLTYANPATRRLLGYDDAELLNRHYNQLVSPTTIKSFVDTFERVKAGEPVINRQFELRHRNGQIVPVELSGTPVEEGGSVTGAQFIIRDITERRAVDSLKADFIAIASHQLRTPLSAIRWYLEMVLKGQVGDLKPAQRDYLEEAYQSNHRMIALVRDLLDVSRAQAGRLTLNDQPVDLNEIIQSVLDEVKPLASAHNVHLKFKPEAIPAVKTDPARIQQVILNLATNAIRYNRSRGTVTLTARPQGAAVLITCQDTGFGISQADEKKIFTKFFRGDTMLKRETEGSGLGLYLAKTIIESLGGNIWFESKVNRGTTFTVKLNIN